MCVCVFVFVFVCVCVCLCACAFVCMNRDPGGCVFGYSISLETLLENRIQTQAGLAVSNL